MLNSPRSRGGCRLLLILLAASCLPLSCGGVNLTGDCYAVELRVHDTTCASAEVAWNIWYISGEENDRGVEQLPWSSVRELCTADIELWAQRECDDDGMVTVEIYIDGALRRSQTAEGPGAIASVDYWLD